MAQCRSNDGDPAHDRAEGHHGSWLHFDYLTTGTVTKGDLTNLKNLIFYEINMRVNHPKVWLDSDDISDLYDTKYYSGNSPAFGINLHYIKLLKNLLDKTMLKAHASNKTWTDQYYVNGTKDTAGGTPIHTGWVSRADNVAGNVQLLTTTELLRAEMDALVNKMNQLRRACVCHANCGENKWCSCVANCYGHVPCAKY